MLRIENHILLFEGQIMIDTISSSTSQGMIICFSKQELDSHSQHLREISVGYCIVNGKRCCRDFTLPQGVTTLSIHKLLEFP
jgi:hypothetical protein